MTLPQRAVLLACTLLLCACAIGPKEPRPPPRMASAIAVHGQASAALARGDFPEAEKLYLRALAQERAIEHVDGIAANLLGLAVTYQRAGQPAQAVRTLDLLLHDEVVSFAPDALAEALYVRSTLALSDGKEADASRFAAQAGALCGPPPCALGERLLELRARVAIASNEIDEALSLAGQAVDAARARKDEAALADALRTHANAWLYRTPSAGLPLAEEAIALDKRLARPDRIFTGLTLLAKLQAEAGDTVLARKTFLRARLVAEADGNRAGLAELSRMEHELVDTPRK